MDREVNHLAVPQKSRKDFCEIFIAFSIIAMHSIRKTSTMHLLVPPLARFELATPWFVAKYSIQMSYGRKKGSEL